MAETTAATPAAKKKQMTTYYIIGGVVLLLIILFFVYRSKAASLPPDPKIQAFINGTYSTDTSFWQQYPIPFPSLISALWTGNPTILPGAGPGYSTSSSAYDYSGGQQLWNAALAAHQAQVAASSSKPATTSSNSSSPLSTITALLPLLALV